MLPTKCYLKDIRNWEELHQVNVLTLFEDHKLENLMLILSVFYKDVPEEELYNMLDTLFNEGYGIIDLFLKLRDILLGYTVENVEKSDEDKNDVTGSFDDIKQYNYLNEYYMHLCMQLMSLGMTYSEFWSLTTKEMYQAFNAIQQKMVLDYNRQMQIAHTQAAMIGAAAWGKLDKEVPQIDIENLHDPDEEIDTPLGRMTRADYKSALELEKVFKNVEARNGGQDNG